MNIKTRSLFDIRRSQWQCCAMERFISAHAKCSYQSIWSRLAAVLTFQPIGILLQGFLGAVWAGSEQPEILEPFANHLDTPKSSYLPVSLAIESSEPTCFSSLQQHPVNPHLWREVNFEFTMSSRSHFLTFEQLLTSHQHMHQ